MNHLHFKSIWCFFLVACSTVNAPPLIWSCQMYKVMPLCHQTVCKNNFNKRFSWAEQIVNQNMPSCFAAMCLFLLFLIQDFKYEIRFKAITTLYFSLWWRKKRQRESKKEFEYEHVTTLMLAAVFLTCVISSWSQSAFGSMHFHLPTFGLILENRKQREETNLWSTSHSISGILLCVQWTCSYPALLTSRHLGHTCLMMSASSTSQCPRVRPFRP